MDDSSATIQCRPCGSVFQVVNAWNGAAVQCPCCQRILTITLQPALPVREPPRSPGFGETILKGLGLAAIAVGVYKLGQAIFDEDFGGGEFPQRYRDEVRDEHVARHGCRCPRCRRQVRYEDLTVDHVVSMKNRGRTSRANSDLMCRSCNSSKGGENSFLDYLRGRSY